MLVRGKCALFVTRIPENISADIEGQAMEASFLTTKIYDNDKNKDKDNHKEDDEEDHKDNLKYSYKRYTYVYIIVSTIHKPQEVEWSPICGIFLNPFPL